jgi:hypothetical protein
MSALRSPIRSALFSAIRAVIQPLLTGGGGGLWDPRQWFTNGEEGTWFDLSPPDMDNLDLGPELNPQVDFNAVGTWVVGSNMSISGGSLNADTNWAPGQSTFLSVLDNLKLYLLEFTVINFVGTGTFQVSAANAPSADGAINVSGNGTYRAVVRNNSASAPVRLRVGNISAAGYSMSIDRLSCKEVLGGYEPALFQDVAGLVFVNQVGQPVGLIRDKSGNGNDIPQATAARRPLWTLLATGKYGITGDGVDDRIERSASGMEWPEFSYLCVGSSKLLGPTANGSAASFTPNLGFWHHVNWQGLGSALRTHVGDPSYPRAEVDVFDPVTIITELITDTFRPFVADRPIVYSVYCTNGLQTAQVNGTDKWAGGTAPYAPISPIGGSQLSFTAGAVWSLSDAVLINRQITDAEFQQYVNYAEKVFGVVTPSRP